MVIRDNNKKKAVVISRGRSSSLEVYPDVVTARNFAFTFTCEYSTPEELEQARDEVLVALGNLLEDLYTVVPPKDKFSDIIVKNKETDEEVMKVMRSKKDADTHSLSFQINDPLNNLNVLDAIKDLVSPQGSNTILIVDSCPDLKTARQAAIYFGKVKIQFADGSMSLEDLATLTREGYTVESTVSSNKKSSKL